MILLIKKKSEMIENTFLCQLIACWFIEATVSGEIGLTVCSLVDLFLLNTSRKSSMLIDSEDTLLA